MAGDLEAPVICPHCNASLLFKQRTGRRCSLCGKRFALEPRESAIRLNDRRVLKAVAALTDEGRLTCTVTQLWWALAHEPARVPETLPWRTPVAHRRTPPRPPHTPRWYTRWGAFGLLSGVALLVIGVLQENGLLTTAAAAAFVFGVVMRGRRWKGRALRVSLAKRPWASTYTKMTRATFGAQVVAPWRAVYGRLPQGLVDDDHEPARTRAREPRFALLCEDATVTTCLAVNGAPERHGLALVARVADVPAGLPVVVLHDAGAGGVLHPTRVRDALPGRLVVDAGLPPRAVMDRRGAAVTRAVPPGASTLRLLRGLGTLDDAERRWLAGGWRSPLAALPPKVLLAGVERAVAEAEAALGGRGPSGTRSSDLGFLDWPPPPVTAAGP
ncbi:hypothetical protein [Streptomyces radicis]|uniref:Uncharacterized protein n=1 Tax=Streptomyces radicis TaxID=1750517 RepID=A0A3A9VZV0_9ACTN|nr:hypothetical protein [Streptomyces radicis]RKN05723.1 hypothetical protein D7319_24690 [Streptomyces radicis]RKN17563.1 hypothetical protein D7318_24055 [Streptomyces radicis]